MVLFSMAVGIAAVGIGYAGINFVKVKRLPEGTKEMSDIAASIRLGANVFLLEEYKVLIKTIIVITAILGAFIQPSSAVAFVIGATMSGVTGFIGMRAATYANVRVTNTARETNSIGRTLKNALLGGSVMGLSVSSFALVGLFLVHILYKHQMENLDFYINWCGFRFDQYSMTLTAYSLGCSIIAIFNRVGGGIFTKAADMGADMVGKGEENIPEDSPQNPATIADATGDDVGDTAGQGSDLLESYMGAIASAMVFIIFLYRKYRIQGLVFNESLFQKLLVYPVGFAGIGLLSCIVGLIYIFRRKDSDNPHKELNMTTWISAAITAVLNLIMSIILFRGESFADLPFRFGSLSPYISAVIGIMSGVGIGRIAEYYTSAEYKPTQKIEEVSEGGAALTVTEGLAVGMKSTLLTVAVLALGLVLSYAVSGEYGIAMAAVGMLSFVTVTVSVDTYGPISDNAGGIAEMAKLSAAVRKITDKLDSEGNTTAAIGKGFCIGAATYTAISWMNSFIYAFTPIEEEAILNVLSPIVLAGILIGGGLTFFFSGMLIESVSKSAQKMVDEVRRQFREIKGLREGLVKPDYKTCVSIATQGALAEMKMPAMISILAPVISGFIMGPVFVAGLFLGATISAIFLAILCGNSGGAWDNSKKSIEAKGLKGTLIHIAAIVGDMIGDPLKDTVGPSLDILIKIMGTVSLMMVPIYSQINLLTLLSKII